MTSGHARHHAPVAGDAVAARVQGAVQRGEDLGQALVVDRLPVELQELERDRVVGAARHGDAAQRGGPPQHLAERVDEGVAAVAGGVHQGAVDVPQDQSHRPCIHARARESGTPASRAGTRPPIGASDGLRGGADHMASNIVRPRDQFPVAELRAAARAAGEAVDDVDYLQSAVHQLSELVGSHMCSLLLLRDGRLFHGGSVGIPAAFMDAIDGSAIGPHVGTCGAAAFRARPMVTTDIREDPKWEHFRALAAAAGLRVLLVGAAAPARAGRCWAPSRPTTTVQGLPTPASWSWPRRTRRWWRSAWTGSGARRGCPRATRRWWWRCRRRWTCATSTRASTPPRPRGWRSRWAAGWAWARPSSSAWSRPRCCTTSASWGSPPRSCTHPGR